MINRYVYIRYKCTKQLHSQYITKAPFIDSIYYVMLLGRVYNQSSSSGHGKIIVPVIDFITRKHKKILLRNRDGFKDRYGRKK